MIGIIVVVNLGNVILIVMNVQGCVGMIMIEISEYVIFVFQIDGVFNFCFGILIILIVEVGFENYQWSNNIGMFEVEVIVFGMIEVIVIDVNGCVIFNSIEVGVYLVLVLDIQGLVGFCIDIMVILFVGVEYVVYIWFIGSSVESIIIDSGGVYWVMVIDVNGCISQDSYQFLEYNLFVVAIGGFVFFCLGGFVMLNVGVDYVVYEWLIGSGVFFIEVDQEGLYILIVIDDNGCINIVSFQVLQQEELSLVILGLLQFCLGIEIQFSVGVGYMVYEWQDGVQILGIIVIEFGFYFVYVEDVLGCFGIVSVDVSFFLELVVSIDVFQGFCVDVFVIFIVNGVSLFFFEWEDGSFDFEWIVIEVGIYIVFVIDVNGCMDMVFYDIIIFFLFDFEVEGIFYFCVGLSIVL